MNLAPVTTTPTVSHAASDTANLAEKISIRSLDFFYGDARALKQISLPLYQGKVTVAHGANGADSRQTAKGLLLGNRAEIDLKPELEILADDVKCAHGAAVGDLDPESLFYLRSRGIPEAEARALLMRAFVGDAVEQIENETVRASIWQAVDAALEGLS